ncbi:MAG: hypothetical protein ABIN36_09705 [Ferruginibacter sp.]
MIEINEMAIRLPGVPEHEAGSVAENIAGILATNMPADVGNRRIEELNIKLSLPTGMDNREMADSIAKQILQQLKML